MQAKINTNKDKPKDNCICKEVSSYVEASVSNMYLNCVVNIEAMELIKIDVPVKARAVCLSQSVKKPEISQKPSTKVLETKIDSDTSSDSSSSSEQLEERVKPNKTKIDETQTRIDGNKVTTTTVTTETVTVNQVTSPKSQLKGQNSFGRNSLKSINESSDSGITSPKSIFNEKTIKLHEKWEVNIHVADLPKTDSILAGGKCDPYFILFLDDKKLYGDRNLALKNTLQAKWLFELKSRELLESKIIRIEWYDKDSIGNDHHIGSSSITTLTALEEFFKGQKCFPREIEKCCKSKMNITGKHKNIKKAIVNFCIFTK